MRIKILSIFLLICGFAGAQTLEGTATLDGSLGQSFVFGTMAEKNITSLSYTPAVTGNFAFSFFGREGVLFGNDMTCLQFGYQFSPVNTDFRELYNLSPTPANVNILKKRMLYHGLFFRVEYSGAGRLQPFVGLAAYLGFIRAPKFSLDFNPQENFYSQVDYTPNAWGRFNPCVSANTGLRYVFNNNWAVAVSYEIFLRNSWASLYQIKAIPATSSIEEKESSEFIYFNGWISQGQFKLMIPLN